MLAYRHGYHAGNHADVLKHAVFIHVLDHLARKGPFAVIDTHSGPGDYDLSGLQGQKLREFERGVDRVFSASAPPTLIDRYLEVIDRYRKTHGNQMYPGTSALTLHLRRPGDRVVLHELHPTDFEQLKRYVRGERHTSVYNKDGFSGLMAHVPPPERRGVVIMDPSYEIKTDYEKAPTTLCSAHRRFAHGVYVLWYPVVHRRVVDGMDSSLKRSGMRKILRIELNLRPDTQEHGMTGSGLYIVNPPYTLPDRAQAALPWLATCLGESNATSRVEWLVPE